MFKVPEHNRVAGDPGENQGYFELQHPKITDYIFFVVASDSKEWKAIKGYEGLYQISNYGEVKSLSKNVQMPNSALREQGERLLSSNNGDDYLRVSLSKGGVTKKHLVHRLVAEHFIDNPKEYEFVNHKDGNKGNANVMNLEWCTIQYNCQHAIETGLTVGFTNADIEVIKNLLDAGKSCNEVAVQFNKSRQTILDVKKGRIRNLTVDEPSGYNGIDLWEHVSITLRKYVRKGKVLGMQMVDRCPTWGEMCYIKGQFWDEEDPVMQFHPPKSQYVNQHSFCLHLWRPTNQEIKLPEMSLVGVPNT